MNAARLHDAAQSKVTADIAGLLNVYQWADNEQRCIPAAWFPESLDGPETRMRKRQLLFSRSDQLQALRRTDERQIATSQS